MVVLRPWVGYETLYLARDLKWLPETIQLRDEDTVEQLLRHLRPPPYEQAPVISLADSPAECWPVSKTLRDGLKREVEGSLVRNDGSRLPISLGVSPVCHGDAIVGAVVVFQDITERRLAEQALHDSEQRMSRILANIPGFAYTFRVEPDGHSCFPYAGPGISEFYGLLPQEVRDDMMPIHMLAHPDDRPRIEATIAESVREVTPFHMDFRICRLGMPERWVEVRSIPEHEADGSIIWYGIMLDIGDRKRIEEEVQRLNQKLEKRVAERTAELQAANRELETFTYCVPHDLRQPLRAIDGFLSLLEERLGTTLDDENRRCMTTISEQALRMAALIDALLSFSRSGRFEMSKAPVDLEALVYEVVREFQLATQGRKVEWSIGELPVVIGDHAMLRMVIGNLLSNALKFTQPRERALIKIGSRKGNQNEVVVYVRDNGVGFEMQYAEKLFGVFQRVHGMEEFKGSGVGVANVRRVIMRHGGHTWAKGKVNEGATIYFTLPKCENKKVKSA